MSLLAFNLRRGHHSFIQCKLRILIEYIQVN